MILKNKSGNERKVKVLFEIEEENKKYVVYEDYNTLRIYAGIYAKNKLKPINDIEYNLINNILEKLYR